MFDALSQALLANNQAGVSAQLPNIATATDQVAFAQENVGNMLRALDDADTSRTAFEQTLAQIKQRAIDADPIAAASELAASQNALLAAQAVAAQVEAILKSR